MTRAGGGGRCNGDRLQTRGHISARRGLRQSDGDFEPRMDLNRTDLNQPVGLPVLTANCAAKARL
jgi:hypothetical protein